MKNLFLPLVFLLLLSVIIIPLQATADGLVPCNDNCGINDFFTMLSNIYEFIVKQIATSLAVVAITVGGIMMLISAGNPNLFGIGKKILYAAIIGLALVWCSYLIIDFILVDLLKYTGGSGWATGP